MDEHVLRNSLIIIAGSLIFVWALWFWSSRPYPSISGQTPYPTATPTPIVSSETEIQSQTNPFQGQTNPITNAYKNPFR